MPTKADSRATVTVKVADRQFPKGYYGVLVRVSTGNRKYDYRMSVQADGHEEAGRKAIAMYSDSVGKPVGMYRLVYKV
jgi:hypothetical protein